MLELKCRKCKSRERLQLHHITYTPLRMVYLCADCHKQITFINTYFRLGIDKSVSRIKLFRIFKRIRKNLTESEIVARVARKSKLENAGARYLPNAYHSKMGKKGDMTLGDYLSEEYKLLNY